VDSVQPERTGLVVQVSAVDVALAS
jgi:hypothetical protein